MNPRGKFLLLLPLGIEFLLVLFLILDHRMPRGHDGFQYYTLQYDFLNNAAATGEIPQWMPFMTHGTVANWWYAVQAGFCQNVWLLFGPLFRGMSFLPLFYLGIFFDELVLFTGSWLLAKRYFKTSAAGCFTLVAILGSCIWMDQPWLNFHFYYAIPLILHFSHRFFETGRWRYCFLAGNFLALQTLGNLPYFLPVVTLAIFTYFTAFHFCGNENQKMDFFILLKNPFCALLGFTGVIASFLTVWLVLKIGTDQIVNYNPGRNPDGTASMDYFLRYGNNQSLKVWMETLMGVSSGLDFTLYFGVLSFPLLVLGLSCNRNPHNQAIWTAALVMFLLSLGGWFSLLCYKVWPLMKYYRHLSMVNSVAKLFLCFAAGFGFDALARNMEKKKLVLFLLSVFLFGVAAWLFFLANDAEATLKFIRGLLFPSLLAVWGQYNRVNMAMSLKISAFFTLLAAFLLVAFTWHREKRSWLVWCALGLQVADLFGYKYYLLMLKTFHANQTQYEVNRFQPAPYAQRRMADFERNPRALPFRFDVLAFEFNNATMRYGIPNWSLDSFLFHDGLGSMTRVDYWLRPLDDYMKIYWGQPMGDLAIPPLGFSKRNSPKLQSLEFPTNNTACLKFAGFSEDKIQVFENAVFSNNDLWVASQMTSPEYPGDTPLLSDPDPVKEPFPSMSLARENSRLLAKYVVLRFDANHVEISVENPSKHPAWLFYSDVWHPLWKATVNGEPKPVFKANLAYKAIQIVPGKNIVRFSFGTKTVSFLYVLIGLNSLAWVVMVLYLMGRSFVHVTGNSE